jgi:hypothetical protein
MVFFAHARAVTLVGIVAITAGLRPAGGARVHMSWITVAEAVADVRVGALVVGAVPAGGVERGNVVLAVAQAVTRIGAVTRAIAGIAAGRTRRLQVVLTAPRPVAGIRVVAFGVGRIATRGAGGQVGVRASAASTDIVRTVDSVISTRMTILDGIILADPSPITAIRRIAFIAGLIPARRARRGERMGAYARSANVVRTVIPVGLTGRAVRSVPVQASSGAVTGIRIGAQGVARVSAGGPGPLV